MTLVSLRLQITSYDSALGMWEPGEELSTSVVKLNVTRADDGRPLPPPEDPFTIRCNLSHNHSRTSAAPSFSAV